MIYLDRGLGIFCNEKKHIGFLMIIDKHFYNDLLWIEYSILKITERIESNNIIIQCNSLLLVISRFLHLILSKEVNKSLKLFQNFH